MTNILPPVHLGRPILREKAFLVKNPYDQSIQAAIDDLIATMESLKICVGLAAPQIEIPLRFFILLSKFIPLSPDTPNAKHVAIINPEILSQSEETGFYWESCQSIPELRGKVFRPRKVTVKFISRQGRETICELSDFAAIVFQHEYDHLNGIVWLDRIQDTRNIICDDEYQRMLAAGTLP